METEYDEAPIPEILKTVESNEEQHEHEIENSERWIPIRNSNISESSQREEEDLKSLEIEAEVEDKEPLSDVTDPDVEDEAKQVQVNWKQTSFLELQIKKSDNAPEIEEAPRPPVHIETALPDPPAGLDKKESWFTSMKKKMMDKVGKPAAPVFAEDQIASEKISSLTAMKEDYERLIESIKKYVTQIAAMNESTATLSSYLAISSERMKGTEEIRKRIVEDHDSVLKYSLSLINTGKAIAKQMQGMSTFAVGDAFETVVKYQKSTNQYKNALTKLFRLENGDAPTMEKLNKFKAEVEATRRKYEEFRVAVIEKISVLEKKRDSDLKAQLQTFQKSVADFYAQTSLQLSQ